VKLASIKAACDAVRQERISVRKAAGLHGVTLSVLQRHLQSTVKPVGRPCKFQPEEEQQLADLLVDCEAVGTPLNKRRLKTLVLAVGAEKGNECLFDRLIDSIVWPIV